MGYGLKALAAGNIFQIDSDLLTTIHLAVHASGVGTSVTGLTQRDIVFARATSSQNGKIAVNYNSAGTEATFRYAVQWVVVKTTTSTTVTGGSTSSWAAENAAGGYGLQVLNSASPPVVCFDSRYINRIGGFEVTEVHAKGAFPGGTYNPAHTSAPFNYSGSTVFSGTLTNKYVATFGGNYSGSETGGELRNGYTFDYNSGSSTAGKIYYRGYYAIGYNVIGLPQFLNFPNLSEVIVGDLKL